MSLHIAYHFCRNRNATHFINTRPKGIQTNTPTIGKFCKARVHFAMNFQSSNRENAHTHAHDSAQSSRQNPSTDSQSSLQHRAESHELNDLIQPEVAIQLYNLYNESDGNTYNAHHVPGFAPQTSVDLQSNAPSLFPRLSEALSTDRGDYVVSPRFNHAPLQPSSAGTYTPYSQFNQDQYVERPTVNHYNARDSDQNTVSYEQHAMHPPQGQMTPGNSSRSFNNSDYHPAQPLSSSNAKYTNIPIDPVLLALGVTPTNTPVDRPANQVLSLLPRNLGGEHDPEDDEQIDDNGINSSVLQPDHTPVRQPTRVRKTQARTRRTLAHHIEELPEFREMPIRQGHVLPAYETLDEQRKLAFLAATRGQVAQDKCKKCASGTGPLSECIILEGYFNGGCCNCKVGTTQEM